MDYVFYLEEEDWWVFVYVSVWSHIDSSDMNIMLQEIWWQREDAETWNLWKLYVELQIEGIMLTTLQTVALTET